MKLLHLEAVLGKSADVISRKIRHSISGRANS